MEERIQARIDELKRGREEHVRTATLSLEGFNAAIGELEALLKPEQVEDEEKR